MVQSDGIYSGSGRTVTPMTDARIEVFLADVLALEGENLEAIREGVHIALGQTPAEWFPNGGESYDATTEDCALFGPIFEYAHSCLGGGSSHHCGAVDYCHLFERRQVRQLHYEQVNQRSRCKLYSGCRRLAPPS